MSSFSVNLFVLNDIKPKAAIRHRPPSQVGPKDKPVDCVGKQLISRVVDEQLEQAKPKAASKHDPCNTEAFCPLFGLRNVIKGKKAFE